MNKEEFLSTIKQQSEQININITQNQAEMFYNYMNILLEWNTKINLTAITQTDEIISKHFIDSLMVSKYTNDKDSIIDVGTGAGFPGIPLKIVKDNIEVTLLDSLNKRVNFLNEVIETLNLEKIIAIHGRAEEMGTNKYYREKYDIAISRAVAQMNVLVEYLLPFVKVGGRCICMKGSNIQEELENSKKAIKALGGEIETVEELTLPNSDIKRNIIIIKKIASTNSKYPRKAGTPTKSPII